MHRRTHARCKGTGGFELANGNVVPCGPCSARGYLVIYTAAEKVANAAAWNRRCEAQAAIKARAAELAATMEGTERLQFAERARQGFGRLADREPDRLEALYRSLEVGRLDDVVRALSDYRRSTGD